MIQKLEYEAAKKYMKQCDLVEFAGNAIFPSRIIRAITGEPVNHSSIKIEMMLVGKYEKRNYIYESDEEGFHPSLFSNRVKKYRGKIYWYPLNNSLDKYRNEIAQEIIALEGVPYDWRSCVGNAFGRRDLDGKRLYCSEAIQLGMNNAITKIIRDIFREKKISDPNVGLEDEDEYLVSLTRKIRNSNKGLRPGELHKTGLWGKPTQIVWSIK